jgi:hypothetical protein
VNAVVAENARPGTRDWMLDRPATARQIEGYASATSVTRGQAIGLYVNTASRRFVIEVFRIGWYRGDGARRVFGPMTLLGLRQPMPAMAADTGLVDCAWLRPFELRTAGDWVSGVHLARLTDGDSGTQSYIFFVVRDDDRRADLLVQLPVTTYQAYNTWGGKSLYHWGSSGGQRAAKVSFNRPYAMNAQNPAAAFGMGAGEFLANLQPHGSHYPVSNAGWDVNMVRWLEREGFDVAYCTNLDTHARAPLPQRCKAFLSSGHDEYWTREMRDHVEAARDAGVHLAFFGANGAYWQVRLEASAASGTADRLLVCHKKAKADPLYAAEPSRSTDKWRSAAVNRPEEQLIGVMYSGDPVDGDIVVAAAGHWAFAATGLSPGDRLSGLLGYEVDCAQGHGPGSLDILAASPWTALTDGARQGTAHMGLYRAASGATVFGSGSMQWAWGLDDFNAPTLRTSRLNAAAQQITRNLLHHMTKPSTR